MFQKVVFPYGISQHRVEQPSPVNWIFLHFDNGMLVKYLPPSCLRIIFWKESKWYTHEILTSINTQTHIQALRHTHRHLDTHTYTHQENPNWTNIESERKWKLLSHVQLFATPWTVACQAPLSMEHIDTHTRTHTKKTPNWINIESNIELI